MGEGGGLGRERGRVEETEGHLRELGWRGREGGYGGRGEEGH